MDIIKKAALKGFCGVALGVLAVTAHAEIVKGKRIVGYFSCGTMICNFVTENEDTFDFEVADKKVANKIFKSCKVDDICAITGNFDDSNILKVIKVENSGKKHKEE